MDLNNNSINHLKKTTFNKSFISQNTNMIKVFHQINFIEIPLDYRDFFYFSWHSSKQQMVIFLADFRK